MDRNNETIRLAKKAADAWRTTDTYHQAAQIIDMLISALEGDTTLTPPNEPLTLEELREMEQSTPVWWDYIPCWVLVRRGSVLVFGSEPHKVENLFGYFYRRPPEGEEDTRKHAITVLVILYVTTIGMGGRRVGTGYRNRRNRRPTPTASGP